MKKLIILCLLLISISFSKSLVIDVCRDWCFQYKIDDVRNWKWLTNELTGERFMRITFFSGKELDLNIGRYDVKVK